MARGVRFIGGFVGAGVLIWAIGFASRLGVSGPSGDLIGTLAIMAFMLTIQAILNAIVYVLVMRVTSRGARTGKRIAAIDLGAGGVASIMNWTGVGMLLVQPVAPGFAVGWVGFVVPGLVSAAVATLLVRVVGTPQ